MIVEKKMIKILYKGPINELSGVYGPITSPYMEKVKTIISMLKTGKRVVEVLADKREIELTLENYNLDMGTEAAHKEMPVVAPVVEKPKKEYVKPEILASSSPLLSDVVKTPFVEEPVATPTVETEVTAPEDSAEIAPAVEETEVATPIVEAPVEEVTEAPMVETPAVEAP